MNRSWIWTLLAVLGTVGAGHAQGPKLTATATFDPAQAEPGDEVTMRVDLQLAPNYHIYGALDENPATLTITASGGLEPIDGPIFPEGTEHELGGIVNYWVEGDAIVTQRFRIPDSLASPTATVRATLDYMVCTPEFCDPPAQESISAKLTIQTAAAERATDTSTDPAPAFGTQDPFDGGLFDQPKVTFDARIEPIPARPGERVDLVIDVTVIDGWHVYGALDENPISVAATAESRLVADGPTLLPDGSKHDLGAGFVNYWVGGSFEMRRPFAVPEDAKPGDTIEAVVQIDYLVCDETSCDPPATKTVRVPVLIEAGAARVAVTGNTAAGTGGAGGSDQGSLWWLISAAVLGALFALLMPCTYPMIPITISFFTKQASARNGRVLPLSLAYGAGIIAIFVVIGLLFGESIIPFATHWVTNLVIAAMFIIFAMSLFGLFTLEPPRFLMNAAGKASSTGGYLGVFLMGACLVITSFTCTVPFVGTMLAIAAKEGTSAVIIGMGVFGLTMALPFVLLSLLPGRMQKLPRAGQWMNTLKVFLGFVEIAAALKFVSNVDVSLNHKAQWLPHDLFLWLWVAIFVIAALYLMGLFSRPRPKIGLGRIAGAAISLLIAAWSAWGTYTEEPDLVLAAIAPPEQLGDHIIVKDDFAKAVAVAKEQGKLLMLNFTGYT